MRCDTTTDARTFHEWADDWLVRDPVRNSVILTVVKGELEGEAHEGKLFAVVRDDDLGGEIVGAAIRTPPFNVYVSPMLPEAIDLVVDAYIAGAPDNGGVNGTTAVATAFAKSWEQRTGARAEIDMHMRIHHLQKVTAPRPTSGVARLARTDERQLLIDWSKAFEEEADHNGPQRDHGPLVDARLAEERAWMWDLSGTPVSYVGTHR